MNAKDRRLALAAQLKAAGLEGIAKEAADRKNCPRLSKELRAAVLDHLFNRAKADRITELRAAWGIR